METLERVAEWLRVSSNQQDESNQEPDNARLIADRGYVHTGIVYRMRVSASKGLHQEVLDQALADARAGKFDTLVAWLPDRLERRGGFKAVVWLQAMLDAGVKVVFSEPTRGPRYDTSTNRGQEEIFRAASYAAEESELRNLRIATGRATAKANGGQLTTPPWGYRITGPKHHKVFTPTADGSKWLPVLFERAETMSARKLEASFTGTPLEGKSGITLWRMIQNTTYTGYIKDADGNVIGRCTPLVTAKAFNEANRARKSRPRSGGPSKNVALLAKIAKCPNCADHGADSGLYHDSSANGRYHYYTCQRHCGVRVRMDHADALVGQIISRWNAPITVHTMVERGHDWSEEIARADLELRQLASLGLDYDTEDAERVRLRAELSDLKSREATPDIWDDVPTGGTFADEYARADDKTVWLRNHSVYVYIAKVDPSDPIRSGIASGQAHGLGAVFAREIDLSDAQAA